MSKSTDRNAPVNLQQARLIADHIKRIDQWQHSEDSFSILQRRLGSTLELNTLLTFFSEEVANLVPFASLTYQCQHKDGHYGFQSGKGGNHHCSYNLSLNGESLGTLRINRKTRFGDDELLVLEQMIALLVQPLRNGWRYQEAINASLTDSMTGLGNNRALQLSLQKEIDLANRHKTPLSLILLDLDHFKRVNDDYGHLFGDEVLARIGELLPAYVRSCDQCFRYGGEEFAVLLPHTDEEAANHVAERICMAIRETRLVCDDRMVSITTSVGIAALQKGSSIPELMRNADKALYQAKRDGRDRVVKRRLSA
ncbi:MAG: GGDEF domain-containing protein [Halomonadaceae bacterium]|nr:MAG: GGDEF domain-containing protein [Halomonadaceae bacterium]